MWFISIICFITLATFEVLLWNWKRRVVESGHWACVLTKEFYSIVRQVEQIRRNRDICHVEQAVLEEHIKFVYDPTDKDGYYAQFEVLIAEISDWFDKAMKHERCFRADDWEEIKLSYSQFKDLTAHIRYEQWQQGYKGINRYV